jgi:response regulator RpfG family c-di-GMP phosphodiesterase
MTEKNLVSTESLSGASLPHEEEKKYRILLVDDEPNYLRASKRVLRQDANSYIIDTATSGLEALSMMANEVYHLVISDNKMPGMSGVDLLAQIRERFPDTIRIMLTGDTDTRAVMGAVKEGVVYRFIRKPVNHGDLRVTVDLAL